MKWFAVVGLLFLISIASAIPSATPATAISSNNFTVAINGITGTQAWVTWGDGPGLENWISPIADVTGASTSIDVIGSPLYGEETVYYQPCDTTGCGNEQHLTLLTVTPVPTTTYAKLMRNITNSRFNPMVISQSLLSAYTTVTPATVLFGIAFFFIMIGIWMRTRSVRLIAILGILISPFIMYTSAGLQLGIPSVGVGVAQGLLAAGLAGVLFSWIRK
jgi:hypothetical protein